jgi:hypothetical protein
LEKAEALARSMVAAPWKRGDEWIIELVDPNFGHRLTLYPAKNDEQIRLLSEDAERWIARIIDAFHQREERLRARAARIPSIDELDALLTKYLAQSRGEPIDLLGAMVTAEARAEAAREHPDPNVRRFLLLDCAAWAIAAVCEIDRAQTSAPIAVTREASDAGGGP